MAAKRCEKPYVCVDVDIPRNARLMKTDEPLACLGLWLAMLAYAREELTDAMVPKRYALSIAGENEKNVERLRQMVVAGLLAEHGEDYEVLRYAPRNQTRAMVEEARAASRERVAKWRAKHESTSVVTDQEQVSNDVQNARVPISTSLSISGSSQGRVQRGELRQPEPGERYVGREDPLTPELTAIAEQNGVQQVEQCWKKFTGTRAGQLLNVAGKFQGYCVSWAQNERKERDKAYEKAKSQPTPHYKPWPVKKASA